MEGLDQVVRSFISAVEEASAHHRRPRGGMQVPFHGDFASITPSSFLRLEWWAERMKKELGG